MSTRPQLAVGSFPDVEGALDAEAYHPVSRLAWQGREDVSE